MSLDHQCSIIEEVCELLRRGRGTEAVERIKSKYPLADTSSTPCAYSGNRLQEPTLARDRRHPRRGFSPNRLALLHARDGYRDRYTGVRVIAPIVLQLLGHEKHGPLKGVLPYHVNGGRGKPAVSGARMICHQAGFELYASYEHVRPISVGGADELSNLVTSTLDTNAEKGTETWVPSIARGLLEEWDGLTGWFLDYTAEHGCSWLPMVAPTRRAIEAALSTDLDQLPAPLIQG